MEQLDPLRKALEAGNISVSQGIVEKFSEYWNMLIAWNQKINLISRRDEGRIVTRHFLESLGLVKVVEFPSGARVMDLGSGAGFPGIPMKLVRPDLKFVLVESKRKRVLFLNKVIEKLNLEGIEIVEGRVEEEGSQIDPVDFVVSRSVADLVTLIKWSRNCLDPRGGRLLVIKGVGVRKELNLLGTVASELGVKSWRLIKYNPFPKVFQLQESYVVVVESA